METAAVPARGWLAPLAVLVAILATVAAAAWSLSVWPPLLALTIPGGLAVTAIAGKNAYGVRTPILAGFFTLVACLPAYFILLWASYAGSLCGKEVHGAWNAVPFAAGALVFFAVGTYGFRTRRSASIVPMAFLFAAVAVLLLFALVPGAPGYCD